MTDPPYCGVCLATKDGRHEWIPTYLKNDDRFTFTCKCSCHEDQEFYGDSRDE